MAPDLNLIAGVLGRFEIERFNSPYLAAFAGFRQDNPDLIAISLEMPSDFMGVGIMGVLGMPVLAQLKPTIDYRAGAVRLERPK